MRFVCHAALYLRCILSSIVIWSESENVGVIRMARHVYSPASDWVTFLMYSPSESRMCLCCVEFTAKVWQGKKREGVGGLNDISFSRFSKVDCANARYVYALLTVYIFAVVHPRDFRYRFARHNAFDRCVQSFAYRLHLLRFVKWNFLCLPNRMKWNLFKIVILEMCYVNIWLCSVTNQTNWV